MATIDLDEVAAIRRRLPSLTQDRELGPVSVAGA